MPISQSKTFRAKRQRREHSSFLRNSTVEQQVQRLDHLIQREIVRLMYCYPLSPAGYTYRYPGIIHTINVTIPLK